MSQRQDSDTDGSGSSSGEWDDLPSPEVLHKYREPKWYMERGAQTEADWYTGPYRGLGIPTGLSAVGLPRRCRVPVRARVGPTAIAGAASVTMSTCSTRARV